MAMIAEQDKGFKSNLRENINHLLSVALVEWKDVPSLYEDFFSSEPIEQIEMLVEWRKAEERIEDLNQLYDGNEMTKDQVIIYNKIYILIEKYTKMIDELKIYSGVRGNLKFN